ncbi:putative rRNA methylase YqxC with S4 and FtsJ domains [Arthrobacter sp. MW3 TE3886]
MSRLDQTLVSRGLARSRTHAARLISEGKVSSGGEVLAKASLQVADDAALDVTASAEDGYVSRAGHKLAGALDAFPAIDVAGKRCLDAGASTRRVHRCAASARCRPRGGRRRGARPAGAGNPE